LKKSKTRKPIRSTEQDDDHRYKERDIKKGTEIAESVGIGSSLNVKRFSKQKCWEGYEN